MLFNFIGKIFVLEIILEIFVFEINFYYYLNFFYIKNYYEFEKVY